MTGLKIYKTHRFTVWWAIVHVHGWAGHSDGWGTGHVAKVTAHHGGWHRGRNDVTGGVGKHGVGPVGLREGILFCQHSFCELYFHYFKLRLRSKY